MKRVSRVFDNERRKFQQFSITFNLEKATIYIKQMNFNPKIEDCSIGRCVYKCIFVFKVFRLWDTLHVSIAFLIL